MPASRTLYINPNIPADMQQDKYTSIDFDFMKLLHKGEECTAFSAQHHSGRNVVIKVFSDCNTCSYSSINNEIYIHSRLNHPNIVTLYIAFYQLGRVFLVIEAGTCGDLKHYMKNPMFHVKFQSEKRIVRRVIVPLLSALEYMHSQGIMHVDVKPENIFLTDDLQVKLGDFGLSVDVLERQPRSYAGTTRYMAPEVIACKEQKRPYSIKADIFSLGVVFHEIIDYALVHYNLSPECIDFLESMLNISPKLRPSVAELLEHDFIQYNLASSTSSGSLCHV